MGRAVALLLLAWMGCSSATGDPASDRAVIDTLRRRYGEAYSAGDVERVLRFYTADAVMMPQSQPAMVGTAPIRTFLEQSFAQFHVQLVFSSEEIVFAGDGLAYERGRYTLKLQARTGGSITDDVGKYLALWRRQDGGSWKIERDIDNSSSPQWDDGGK